ncbi:integrase catalytic domain-containing protein [Trichonephila clavata]|uniref:Integrase catalytic domain-containing protein n=1 Tax=Trichonephila clavata TaxID=2740835 RepID=A0A8X6J2D7_TRICU|nr:integrase catalytic domain-containing protein [Trichonephila clavata]
MQDLQPTLVPRHSKSNIFIHKNFPDCSHVFVRQDCVRWPFQQPYDGAFKVISRKNKFFNFLINGKKNVISVDRLNPAFMELEDPVPAQEKPARIGSPDSPRNSSVQTKTSTRYGRRVRFRLPNSSK